MYGKHFASTYTGSMYGAGVTVFAVWGYVIANTVDSTVELNPKMLAGTLGCTESEVQVAIDYLCSPDTGSRNPSEDGRRLVKEGSFQYHVVTHAVYRNLQSNADRRAYFREKQRESRERKKQKINNAVNLTSFTVKPMSNVSTQAEAISNKQEENTETKTPSSVDRRTGHIPENVPELGTSGFDLEESLNLIKSASPKQHSSIKFEKAFFEASKRLHASGEHKTMEDASTWLLGRILRYYDLVKTTWPPQERRYAKTPQGFFEDESYLEDAETIWDRSQPTTESDTKGKVNARDKRTYNNNAIREALSSARQEGGANVGNGAPDDSARQDHKPRCAADIFADVKPIHPKPIDNGIRKSGSNIGVLGFAGGARKINS